jgi:glycogen debranching enzyme
VTDGGADDRLVGHDIVLPAERLTGRSFLLGNRAGFTLYLPVASNERDATLQGSKWYGASGFGQSFLEGFVIWVEVDGAAVLLDRSNQTEFIMRLDEAIQVFEVSGRVVRERYFVPNGVQAVVLSLEGDLPFGVRPELDMRYYQALNDDFSSYGTEQHDDYLVVRNRVTGVGPLREVMDFYGAIGTIPPSAVELIPEGKRLIDKTYLKDEAREKAIESVYTETGYEVPDEAPIWNRYSTRVYSPARFRASGSVTMVCAFGDTAEAAVSSFEQVKSQLELMRADKRTTMEHELADGAVETGNKQVDDAYAHVLTRFNDCLVARDAVVRVSGEERQHFNAIFAGNKYFMDAWKRDENISLGVLLATSDFETVRAILDSTWQFQDERTGRLPQIIRAGEALVYYSSDGTLWALHRLFQYTRQSGDTGLVQQKLPMVQHFFKASLRFVQRGLLPSGGIIDPHYLWETWEDTPFTPRDGYPVEIELLWLTVLAEFSDLIADADLATEMRSTLQQGRSTFEQFYADTYLFDSLGYDWTPRRILTPNGYLAFDLQYSLPPSLEHAMVFLARDQLAARRGVRSLAPRDWPAVFPAPFLDDPRSHTGKNMASFGIFNYHRGIEWEWFNPTFVAGELLHGDVEHAYGAYTSSQVDGALHDAGIGGLSELYDEHGQLGADFQAWSMAALIESVHRYAGVAVDAAARTIRLAPWIPADWPYLQLRRRVGDLRFDVRYDRMHSAGHRLRLQPLTGTCHGYTVALGVQLDDGRHVQSASLNGQPITAGEWTYDDSLLEGTKSRAWLSLPLSGDIDLRVTSEEGSGRSAVRPEAT